MTNRPVLFALGALGLAGALWLAVPGPVARLGAARTERARLAAELARPPVAVTALLPREAILPAPDAATAGRQAAGRVTDLAARAGLLVERAAPEAGPPGLATVDIALSGDEARLRRFIGALEEARPAIRLARWRIEALPGGGTRLKGRAAMAWAPAPLAPSAGRFEPMALARPAAIEAGRALFAEEPAAAAPGEGPALLGVVGRLGQDAVALVRGPDGRARRVAPGETVDGWTLRALSADAAFFTRGGERLRVPLPAADEMDQ